MSGDDEIEKKIAGIDRHRILKFIFNKIRDLSASEDLVQEVLRRVVVALKDPDRAPIDHVEGFAFVTAEYVIKEWWRARQRSPLANSHPIEDLNVRDPQPEPEWICDRDQLSSQLLDAIRSMPKQRARIVYLYFVRGLTAREVSAEMQITEATVRTHVAIARRDIRDGLQGDVVRRGFDLLLRLITLVKRTGDPNE